MIIMIVGVIIDDDIYNNDAADDNIYLHYIKCIKNNSFKFVIHGDIFESKVKIMQKDCSTDKQDIILKINHDNLNYIVQNKNFIIFFV